MCGENIDRQIQQERRAILELTFEEFQTRRMGFFTHLHHLFTHLHHLFSGDESLERQRKRAQKGAEVTVEPEDNSECGSFNMVEGSYFSVVDVVSTGVGIDVMYTVITTNGERHEVRREYLRHRKWHRIAFWQVTNDKKHDCWSSQAFADKRLNFFDIFNKDGFDAAREFAWNDRAEQQRKKMKTKKLEAASSRGVITYDSISLNTNVDLNVNVVVSNVAAVSAAKRPASRENKMTGTRSDDLQQKFEEWYAHLQHEKFWAWLEESDNATHFKSKENLNFWSERPSQEHCNFLRTVWVEYGCPGHGKGP